MADLFAKHHSRFGGSRYVQCSAFFCSFATLIHYRQYKRVHYLKFWGEEAAKMQFCVYSSRVGRQPKGKVAERADGWWLLKNEKERETECAKYHSRNTYEICYSTTNPTPLRPMCVSFSSFPFLIESFFAT